MIIFVMEFDWSSSQFARPFLSVESSYMARALKQVSGPSVLMVGNSMDANLLASMDYPSLVQVESHGISETANLIADPAFLPFADEDYATVILPHVLEQHKLPHQVLREAYRVLQPEGHLILSCFNPYSLVGLQRLFRHKGVLSGSYYSLSRVKDWMHLLGFEIAASSIYQYAPLSKSEGAMSKLKFLNSIGDRWFPMLGGGYLILARKRYSGMRLVGVKYAKSSKRRRLATSVARKQGVEESPS